jgi:hypothetical protein
MPWSAAAPVGTLSLPHRLDIQHSCSPPQPSHKKLSRGGCRL